AAPRLAGRGRSGSPPLPEGCPRAARIPSWAERIEPDPGSGGWSRMESVAPIPPRLRPLLDPASPVQELAGRLVARGHRCYLVGGSVRDALLDVEQSEDFANFDLASDARPHEVEGGVRGWGDHVWLQGKRFGTVGGTKGGVLVEVTTFRAEVYRPESRKPEVAFADDIETDLSRRDFTINAMALRLPDPELIDPFGGAADLGAKRL